MMCKWNTLLKAEEEEVRDAVLVTDGDNEIGQVGGQWLDSHHRYLKPPTTVYGAQFWFCFWKKWVWASEVWFFRWLYCHWSSRDFVLKPWWRIGGQQWKRLVLMSRFAALGSENDFWYICLLHVHVILSWFWYHLPLFLKSIPGDARNGSILKKAFRGVRAVICPNVCTSYT